MGSAFVNDLLLEFPNISRIIIGDNSFMNTRMAPIVCVPQSREELFQIYANTEVIEDRRNQIMEIMKDNELSSEDFASSMIFGRKKQFFVTA